MLREKPHPKQLFGNVTKSDFCFSSNYFRSILSCRENVGKMKQVSSKQALRNRIAAKKNTFSETEFRVFSSEVISMLELTSLFQDATCILSYYSILGEVETHDFIDKYHEDKCFILPVVRGNELALKKFTSPEEMIKSSFGIFEPTGGDFVDFDRIDLVLVPGVAFDRELHRLGRGKGFYDRLLPLIQAPKIGVCFDFQLFDHIPYDKHDVKMNMIVSQNEIVTG